MFRVRLINKVIGPTAASMHPVCGISGKFYGQAVFVPEHGGPVFDMNLEDYERDKFDIVGNVKSRQQWIPEFYECIPVIETDGTVTYVQETTPINGNLEQQIGAMPSNGRSRIAKYNELRTRAKAAGVWKQGMKLVDLETALVDHP